MVDEIVESVDQHGSRLDGRIILEPRLASKPKEDAPG
jgi:hypothetical protein